MRRARLILVLVALAVALPVGLLVQRALQSAKAEERAQRQALADTAFAAVERELAALLDREESRAWDEWRHLRVPEGEVAGSLSLVRSPLAELPEEPWNLGWFQVEPDGTIGTPFVPEAELAQALGLGAPPAAARQADTAVRGQVERWLAARPARPARPAPVEPVLEAEKEEASASLLERLDAVVGREASRESAPAAGAAADDEESAARPAQQQLGKTKSFSSDFLERRRQERAAPRKAEVFQKQGYAETVQQVADNAGVRSPPAPEPEPELDAASPARPAEGAATAAGARRADAKDDDRAALRDAAEAEPASVDVVVEPFLGELAPDGRLVLHRLVVVAGTTYRQGLIVDVGRLAEEVNPLDLLARTAGVGGSFSLVPATEPPAAAGGLVRRLPAPFDALRTVLRLGESAGLGARRLVLWLAALVAAFGLAGLVGLDRMVAARLADAQRRSDFVSAVTHELKTPLAAIRLHGEMLQQGIAASEEKRADSYRTITAECERLTRLVDNVLELSRLEKGTRSVSLSVGPIAPVLREALELMEPHARASGFSLELDCDESLAARFDRDALLQVVFNLVDNAIKYSRDADDKRVGLRARPTGDGVALCVRDHGPGVPPRQLARVFEPFWRGERELTRRTKGTGIGLALVQGLVERMGGRAEGRNAEGGGFEVKVLLPGGGSPPIGA